MSAIENAGARAVIQAETGQSVSGEKKNDGGLAVLAVLGAAAVGGLLGLIAAGGRSGNRRYDTANDGLPPEDQVEFDPKFGLIQRRR